MCLVRNFNGKYRWFVLFRRISDSLKLSGYATAAAFTVITTAGWSRGFVLLQRAPSIMQSLCETGWMLTCLIDGLAGKDRLSGHLVR